MAGSFLEDLIFRQNKRLTQTVSEPNTIWRDTIPKSILLRLCRLIDPMKQSSGPVPHTVILSLLSLESNFETLIILFALFVCQEKTISSSSICPACYAGWLVHLRSSNCLPSFTLLFFCPTSWVTGLLSLVYFTSMVARVFFFWKPKRLNVTVARF